MQLGFSHEQDRETSSDVGMGAGAITLFVESAALRLELIEDASALGLRVVMDGTPNDLVSADAARFGHVVFVECMEPDAAQLAALTRAQRVARAETRFVVLTGLAALDVTFGAIDPAKTQVLVGPTHGDRLIALGASLVGVNDNRLRELSQDDRLTLLRLTEQMGEISRTVETLSG